MDHHSGEANMFVNMIGQWQDLRNATYPPCQRMSSSAGDGDHGPVDSRWRACVAFLNENFEGRHLFATSCTVLPPRGSFKRGVQHFCQFKSSTHVPLRCAASPCCFSRMLGVLWSRGTTFRHPTPLGRFGKTPYTRSSTFGAWLLESCCSGVSA